MNEQLKKRVRASGLKQNFLAGVIGIHEQYFSMIMRGDKKLSDEKEIKLKEYLDKLPKQ